MFNQIIRVILFSQLLILSLGIASGFRNEEEERVYKNVMKNYNKNIFPPSRNSRDPVMLAVSIHIIDFFLQDSQKATWHMYFRLRWTDRRLIFNSSSVDSIQLSHSNDIWVPDAFIPNAIETKILKTLSQNTLLSISSNGDVLLSNRLLVTTTCMRSSMRFPVDDVVCELQIESYSYSAEAISFREPEAFAVNSMEMLIPFGFSQVNSEKRLIMASTSTGNYSRLQFAFVFKRNFNYYVAIYYIPCIMLVIVSFFNHILDAKHLTQRLLLTLVPLMILSSFCAYIRESSPPAYATTFMDIFAGVSVLTSFLVLLQVMLEFYVTDKKEGKKSADLDQSGGTKKKIKEWICRISRLILFVFYILFLIVYFTTYG